MLFEVEISLEIIRFSSPDPERGLRSSTKPIAGRLLPAVL